MKKKKGRRIQSILLLLGTAAITVFARHYEYPDININHVEEIIIPGMTGEYEFLFLTDLHMAIKTSDDIGPLGDADTRMAGFVNAKGTVSAKQFPQWVAYANKEKLDAVLFGGDIIDYYSDANASYLMEQLEDLAMPYLFTIGNHDLFSPWGEVIPKDEKLAFQVLEYEEFSICSIDNEAYQVSEDSLVAMKAFLAENENKPVILLAHVPFYTKQIEGLKETSVSVWGQPLLIGEGALDLTAVSVEFLNLVFGEESPVVAVFTGDNHFYYKGNLTDSITQWVIDPSFAGNGTMIKVRGM